MATPHKDETCLSVASERRVTQCKSSRNTSSPVMRFCPMKKSAVLLFALILTAFAVSGQFLLTPSSNAVNAAASRPDSKIVYLTFDDGPAVHTPKILDILWKYDVPATFFVVGNTKYTHYMKDIIEKGHAIGLHSYSHKMKKIYSSQEAFFDDLKKIDDIVFNETGVRSQIIRFPGGSSVKRGTNRKFMDRLGAEVQKRGYQYFDWNCDSKDTKGIRSISKILSNIKSGIKTANSNHIVVLMHDTKKATVKYLPSVIEFFKEQGFEFKTLTKSSPPIHHDW